MKDNAIMTIAYAEIKKHVGVLSLTTLAPGCVRTIPPYYPSNTFSRCQRNTNSI